MNQPIDDFEPTYLQIEPHDDVVVARFSGEVLGEDANLEQIGDELFALTDQFQYENVVLSLRSVKLISSSVLGKIISLHRKLHRLQGKLVLCDIQPSVEEVLVNSSLIHYFHIADDTEAALNQLQ